MEWISVKDRIYPQERDDKFLALAYEECGECESFKRNLSIHEAEMSGRDAYGLWEIVVRDSHSRKILMVTHWLPIPELPKEK